MKKAITWISIITFIILLIDLGIMGLKILEHNYNIIIEGYIGSTCYLIFFTCIILKFFTNKCPYCGKVQIVNGKYCPHCGKELK